MSNKKKENKYIVFVSISGRNPENQSKKIEGEGNLIIATPHDMFTEDGFIEIEKQVKHRVKTEENLPDWAYALITNFIALKK